MNPWAGWVSTRRQNLTGTGLKDSYLIRGLISRGDSREQVRLEARPNREVRSLLGARWELKEVTYDLGGRKGFKVTRSRLRRETGDVSHVTGSLG